MPEELSEGIFVAGTLTRPKRNHIPVRILNVREEPVILKNYQPKIQKTDDYEICNFNTSEKITVKRIETIIEQIKFGELNKEERDSIQRICAKYADIFRLDDDPISTTNVYTQSIQLKKNVNPVYKRPYRLPQSQKEEISKQIETMLKDGIIEPAKSPWNAPLLIVAKKIDNSGKRKWRIVIDYRSLNDCIEDDKFPLPCITEILDSLSGAIYFSHLDLSQGYYQVQLDPNSRLCTAFLTDRGQFQMTRLPMGMKTSASGFSRAMTIAMSGLNYNSCFVYLDDLIVFGNSLFNHNKNLIRVMERLREVNLKLNPNKCEFLKKEILYLGHIISSHGISPDPEKTKALLHYPTPKNAQDVKRFVAFASYYRKFINKFAHKAEPLNRLTRKNADFQWTEEVNTSFEELKNALIAPPVLEYPNFTSKFFILRTDASGFALGAILCNDNDKPIAYASRSLNNAERNYCTIEKELLAIVWAVKYFRPYLFGRKFNIYTDHRPLVYLFGMTNPSSRLTKFRLTLEEYDFVVLYVKGKDNPADALSRVELTANELKTMTDTINSSLNIITRARTKQLTSINSNGDEESNIKRNFSRIDHPGLVEILKKPFNACEIKPVNKNEFDKLILLKDDKNYYILNNIIFEAALPIIYYDENRISHSTLKMKQLMKDIKHICDKYCINELFIFRNEKGQIFINKVHELSHLLKTLKLKISILKDVKVINDKETKQIILNDYHLLPTGGHSGINRMYNKLKEQYYWTGIRRDVENFVRRCDECQRYKHSRPLIEPLEITTTAKSAFETIFLDLVGPLETDAENNKYILTLQCELSKFVEAYPLANKESLTVAKSFVSNFILRYGIPQKIVTDKGTEFISELFSKTCEILNVKHLTSTAYHHETLGALENSHKHLGAYLRMQVANHANSWSTWLPFWCFSYNTAIHSGTKFSPYELVFGKVATLPTNLNKNTDPLYNFDNYPLELKYRLQEAQKEAHDNLVESKNKRKLKFDQTSMPVEYKLGNLVLVRNIMQNKLDPVFKGPYEVIKVNNPNVTLKVNNKMVTVHKNRIKKYYQ